LPNNNESATRIFPPNISELNTAIDISGGNHCINKTGHSVFIDAQNQQQKLSIGGDKLQWAGIV
jgi:hypothetical protein